MSDTICPCCGNTVGCDCYSNQSPQYREIRKSHAGLTFLCQECSGHGYIETEDRGRQECPICDGDPVIDYAVFKEYAQQINTANARARRADQQCREAEAQLTLAVQHRDAARAERDTAMSVLCSTCDLANSWAREVGVEEAAGPETTHKLIDRLWSVNSMLIHQKTQNAE